MLSGRRRYIAYYRKGDFFGELSVFKGSPRAASVEAVSDCTLSALRQDTFQRLLHEEGITGENLLSFGDGPVEISSTKELGGLAIAVCSDESHNGSGVMDTFKRKQLFDAGADALFNAFVVSLTG